MEIAEKRRGVRKAPGYLIKEVLDGIPVYYKGYRDVMRGKETFEGIKGDSLLVVLLKTWLARLLIENLGTTKYWIGYGEIGIQISNEDSAAHGVVVFDKVVLPPAKISNRYADVPAKVVIEIDTEVEYGDGLCPDIYVQQKTQRTLDFGTERVIWIFTATRKVLVATPGRDWTLGDWDQEIEILDGVKFNVAAYLRQEGITLDDKA